MGLDRKFLFLKRTGSIIIKIIVVTTLKTLSKKSSSARLIRVAPQKVILIAISVTIIGYISNLKKSRKSATISLLLFLVNQFITNNFIYKGKRIEINMEMS